MNHSEEFIPIESEENRLLRELNEKVSKLEESVDKKPKAVIVPRIEPEPPAGSEHIGVPILRALRDKSPQLTDHAHGRNRSSDRCDSRRYDSYRSDERRSFERSRDRYSERSRDRYSERSRDRSREKICRDRSPRRSSDVANHAPPVQRAAMGTTDDKNKKIREEMTATESLKRRGLSNYYAHVKDISGHKDVASFLSDMDYVNSHGIKVPEEDAKYLSRLSKILQCIDNVNLNAPGHIVRSFADNRDIFKYIRRNTSSGAKLYCQQINNKFKLAEDDTDFTCLESMLLALTHTLLKKWKD